MSRILEKQNRSQISQVFLLYPHINYWVVLLFKDSIRGAASLKQEITLSHGQHCGRLTSQKLSVGNHLIGFGINRYFRLPIVVNHVGLSELANAADWHNPFGQAVFSRNARSHCRLRNKSQRRSTDRSSPGREHFSVVDRLWRRD